MALTLFTYACPDNTNIKSNTPIPACFSPIPFFHSFSFVGSGRQATQAVFWCDFWLVCTETNGFFYLFLFTSLFLPGIWSRDIRYKSNLPLTEINKILKNLESKKLIKAVKSVAVSILRLFFFFLTISNICCMVCILLTGTWGERNLILPLAFSLTVHQCLTPCL